MGIELPPELAGVAAQAGVSWPQADEDKLRASAQAWRTASTRLTALTTDADGSANHALAAVTGTTGTAARQHWQTFVAPDTGHLTSTAAGCTAAADRLDHAADQVGAAKVRIVSHLVDLAKQSDAADAAAAAGHPAALAGVPTLVRGTAGNVAQVNHDLTNSIRLDGPTQPNQSGPLADLTQTAQPVLGQHGPLGQQGPLGHDSLVPQSTVTSLAQPVVGRHGPLGDVGQVAQPLLGGQGPLGGHDPLGGQGQLPGPLGGVAQSVPPVLGGGQGPGSGGLLGQQPVPATDPLGHGGQDPARLPLDPTQGGQSGPGQGGLSQLGQGQLGQGQLGQGGPSQGPGQSGSGSGGSNSGGPGDPLDPGHTGPISGLPLGGRPAQPIGPVLSGHEPGNAPTPPLGVTVAQSAAPALAPPQPAAPLAAAPPPAAPPIAHQPLAAPSAPTPSFGTQAPDLGGSPAAPPPAAMPAAPPPSAAAPVGRVPVSRASQSLVVGNTPPDRSAAVPPQQGRQAGAVPGTGRPKVAPRSDAAALFMVYVFPIGQLPTPSSRPHRQLPPPPADSDFAAGLRFEPHDHPESHLIDTDTVVDQPVLDDGVNAPDDLATGHDPTGGAEETEWARRFLVRPADDGHAAEYAWPPGELFPEGGDATGEPVVLVADTVLDRLGGAEGRVFAADGTAFATRSLPPDHLDAGYHRYRVLRDLPVWRAVSAPWFGQPGGGVRYRALYPAADLVALGYLGEITRQDDGH